MRPIGWLLLCLLIPFAPLAADGETRLARLFGNDYDFWDADWSPDGRCLALAGKTHYQSAAKARIWLSANGTDKPLPWTNTDDYCDDWPRWAPDGQHVALVRRELGAARRTCIWWKETSTGIGRRLTKGPDDRQPSWSPDSSDIVFRRGLGPRQSILAVFEVASGKVTALPLPEGLLGEPCWGSDGAIYYTRYSLVEVVGNGRVWRYQPETGRGGPLLAEEFDQRMPVLSPDGKRLAFYGQRNRTNAAAPIPDPANWALYLRDQVTGKVTEVVTDVALTGGPPVWSRDSQTVIFYSLRAKLPALWSMAVPAVMAESR